MFEMVGFGHPVRLFVGGLHGREGVVTEPLLRAVSKVVPTGSLILCNFTVKTRYVSTLNAAYYSTKLGRRLVTLIRTHKPEIYIELHSYRRKAYTRLTDPKRQAKTGVPPLTDLDDALLLGSVSPHIRTSEFRSHDICLTLDIPWDYTEPEKVIAFLNLAVTSRDRVELLHRLRERYPIQFRAAEATFQAYFKAIRST
jgi:hypothetical protein